MSKVMTDKENRSAVRKAYQNATLSTTNSIWIALGYNTGLRGEKRVINC
jgi:hypothetical protein